MAIQLYLQSRMQFPRELVKKYLILARYAVGRESTGTNHARLLITFSWYEYHMEQKPPADIFRKDMNTR